MNPNTLEHPKSGILVRSRPNSSFTHDILSPKHSSVADEPLDFGGENLGMNPYEYLLGALGACTSMTLKMYARRKGFDLENVEVFLEHHREKDADGNPVEKITRKIVLHGNLSDEEKARLIEIAHKCPVHKTLAGNLQIDGLLVEQV